ncbi:uncharacterized protein LOC143234465 isoform X1 [Tachypleus tridentatus]|uniref:uncharacterized protein LOC143234465 isoform X1 n=2 Tax=Tachypleus tridentatus TaxID=6853 RepID=UPI003FD5B3E6
MESTQWELPVGTYVTLNLKYRSQYQIDPLWCVEGQSGKCTKVLVVFQPIVLNPLSPKTATWNVHSIRRIILKVAFLIAKKLKYPREIICQYHCHHGYTIPSIQRNKTVIQCLGPYWNSTVYPECKVMACTSPPQIDHGSFNCIPGKFGELTSGTICNYHCDKGYVTPLSQSKLTTWKCLSNFQWNITDKPTCLRTVPPEPLNCTDQIMVTETGFAEVKKPRFTDVNGKDLDVECTLTKPLKLGNHSNVCKSIDTELQTSAKCTYRIQVIALKCEQLPSVEHGFLSCIAGTFGEFTPGAVCTYKCENGFVIPTSQSDMVARICLSSSRWNVTQLPECWKVYPPKPVNCDNQTLVAKLGVVKVTKPRFVAGDGRELNVMCSLEGLLEPGDHVNFCDAFDPELLTGGVCIYTISVKVPVCAPLPRIDHGSLTCIPGEYGELTPGTICSYHCEKEYTIPLSQTEIMTRICEPHLKWNTTKLPMCLKAYYPKPLDCFNQTLITEEGIAWLQKPRFVAGDGRELDVKCTLKGKLKPGEYINLCESTDPELQTVGFCSYRIIVKVPTCDPPPQPEYGYIECNTTESDKYPIGTICYYSCLSDYIIPTSQSNLHITVCLALLQWNITSFPECKKKLAPYPKEGACKDEIFETNDPSSITLEPPTFVRAQGDTAMVSCSLTTISSYGIYKNLCRATDPELQTSTSCTYKIEVKHLEQGDDALRHRCDPLNAPANGYIQCQTVEKKLLCDIKCKSGFSMPSNFHLLQEGYVECDPLHGLWNFQRIYRIQRLPDCLAGLPHTMIEGSIKFKTDVRDCLDYENLSLLMDVIKKGLLDRNQEICGQIDCNRFIFSCSGGLGGVKPTLETMWTFQAINEPGTATQDRNITALIETVQFDTKAIIVSDPTFKNEFLNFSAILLEETFTDTHFHLVCQERGFVVNITTNRCWECPTGTYEEDNQCKNCPGNHYQDMTGQTKCKSCPRGTISYSGSRSLVDCKVMSVSSDLDLPELVRDQPYIDECTPNPCKNHGTCTNAPKDSYHCHCKRGYKGHLCQYRQLQKQYFCLNGGTLVLKTRYQFLARCLCPPGYSGRRCGNVKGT